MKLLPFLAIFLALAAMVQAAEPGPALRLWEGDAPLAKGMEPHDIPTITPYIPGKNPMKAAMVIAPGGGYGGLAAHEGDVYARWLNDQGIAAFVLTYRLGSKGYRHPAMLYDVSRAVRLVRSRAESFGIDAAKVGIMGSSAGGHLASTLLTHYDAGKADSSDPVERQSSRPALGILCYPVISMGIHTHGGSRANLLGPNPSPDLVQLLSNELHVTRETPRCFIFHTFEDKAVKIENALAFVAALQKNDIPFDFHVYQKGPHGIGLGSRTYDTSKLHPWTADCIFWLKEQGFVAR